MISELQTELGSAIIFPQFRFLFVPKPLNELCENVKIDIGYIDS